MRRALASLTLLTLSVAGCNEHPLVGVEYDHYTGGALGGGTDSDTGDSDDTPTSGGTSGAGSGSTSGLATAGSTSITSSGTSEASTGASDESSTGGRPYCGDGEVDEGEACDDADMNGTPGFCSADCQSLGPQ